MHTRSYGTVFTAILILGTACSIATSNGPQSRQVSLDREFDLSVGQEAYIGEHELVVRFSDVLEDSRCPSDVNCIQAGNAAILIVATPRGGETKNVQLNTGRRESRSGQAGPFRIELVQLLPYPRSERPTKLEDYVATLVVGTL